MKVASAGTIDANVLAGFGAPASDPREAEIRGMQRMLALLVQSPRKDYPTLVGRMRRVIEAASEEVAH